MTAHFNIKNLAGEISANPEMENQKQTEGVSPASVKNPENIQKCSSTIVSAVASSMDINNVAMSVALPPCPESGSGVHYWIMSAAWRCKNAGLAPDIAMKVIEDASTRQPHYREMEDAIAKVYECESLAAVQRSRPITAKYDPEVVQRVADKLPGFNAANLSERSPVDPTTCTPADFLACLYRPGEKVLIFKDNFRQGDHLWVKPPHGQPHDSLELDSFRNVEQAGGVVFLSNPVCGEYKEIPRLASPHNPSGRSRRCEECMTAFPYLLLESDKVDPEIWIRALAQLPLPVSSVTTSGGGSIHALLHVDAATGEEWRAIKDQIDNELVTLGADPAAMTAVRLTRLPGCYRREKEAQQVLLYLNPNPDGTPIADQPVRLSAAPSQPENITA